MNRDANICPDCGAPIPVNAPQGLCPKCLMSGAAVPTEAGSAATARPDLPAPSVAELARAFPQLEIIGLIGRGGMGYVYRARQPKLERDVALKILPQHLAAQPGFAERFAREGRLLAKLNHPNIVTVHDFGSARASEFPSPIPQTPVAISETRDPIPHPPFYYLLMEFVDGVNLRQAMRASRFTPAQALAIVPAICEALQFAHDEGVLHRDIKPENILIDAKGRVKIADFGIAKLMERGSASRSSTGTEAVLGTSGTLPAAGSAAGHRPALRELTGVSSALGTPQYMAPEQIERPSDVDHRADIYSLGVVFYELLTGELPVGKFAPPSARTPLDERVDQIVLRALAKERELRQQSARELRTEVETVGGTYQPESMTQIPADESAARVSPVDRRTLLALGVAMFYAGLVILLTGWTLFGGLGPAVALLLAAVLLVTVTLLFIRALRFGRAGIGQSERQEARRWIRGFAVVAAVVSLPVCGFGLFFLGSAIDELTTGTGSWNPAPAEAVIVPLAILGLGLLPWATWQLHRSGSSRPTPEVSRPEQPTGAESEHEGMVGIFLVASMLGALLLAFSNPWGPVAWKWFAVICTAGGFVVSWLPGKLSLTRKGLLQGLALAVSIALLLVWFAAHRAQKARLEEQAALASARAASLVARNNALDELARLLSQPPVVVETQPASGARDVPFGSTELHVRFSKEMQDGSWSWVEAWEGSTPEMLEEPRYDESRLVCSVKVRLEPGRTYAWWLNAENFTNFKDTNGNPAVPYLLIFETRAAPETP